MNENSRQSTRHTDSISLFSRKLSGNPFAGIITDRMSVIHGVWSSSSESKVFAAFLLNFYKQIILQFQQIRVVRWGCDWYIVLIIVTVQIYDKQNDLYHWKGCLINMTDTVSGLMSFYIQFWCKCENFKSIQRHSSPISFEWSLRSRNMIIELISINGYGVSDQYDGYCE